MATAFFNRIFGNNSNNSASKRKADKQRRGRQCRIEELEGREMLSATPWALMDDTFYQSPQYENDTIIVNHTVTETISNAVAVEGIVPLTAAGPLTQAEFNTIRTKYADLGLTANMSDYNIIVINADQLSDAQNLFNALSQAATTAKSDLIVCRTTQAQNTILLAGNELAINHSTTNFGSTFIVGLSDDGSNKKLTIDANNNSRIFNIGSNATVGLAGMVLTKGRVAGNGGAIISAGTLTITDCEITGNTTSSSGGGIYSSNTLTLMNCKITGNTATASSSCGGGICSLGMMALTDCTISGNSIAGSVVYGGAGGGGIYSSGTMTLTNCTISGNTSSSDGGGVYDGGSSNTITNCTISGNTSSSDGGGIYNRMSNSTSTLTNCTITRNSTSGSYSDGGGIYNSGTLTLTNCTISDNTASSSSNSSGGGGGIYNDSGTLTIIGSTISGNTASNTSGTAYGGGIYSRYRLTVMNSTISGNSVLATSTSSFFSANADSYGGGIYFNSTTTLINCVISGNSATATSSFGTAASYGGGIYSQNNSASTIQQATNCTIAGNTAADGGGIYVHSQNANTGRLTINNTLVALNTAKDSASHDVCESSTGTIAGNYNLIGNGSGQSTLVNDFNGNLVGTTGSPIAPGFVSFTPYTTWSSELWMSWNLRLVSDSPAKDKGSNARAIDANGNPLFYDASNQPRIMGGTVDMGAYEFSEGQSLVVPTGVTATVKSYNTITLTWNPVSGATSGYTVQYATDESFTQNIKLLTVDNGNSVDITGLERGTEYYFRVIANQTATASISLPSATVSEIPVALPLSTPTGVTATSASSTSLTVTWNTVADAYSYRVEYSTDPNFATKETRTEYQPYSGNTVSTTLYYLTTNVTYYIRVVAISGNTNNYSNSPESDVAQGKPDKDALPRPTNVTASSKNATTLTVNWSYSNSNATGFMIEYSTDAGFPNTAVTKTQTVSGGTTRTADIGNLTTGAKYYVRVLATGTGSYGDSLYSDSADAVPSPPQLSTPSGVTASSKNTTTLTVSWSSVTNATGYVIQYSTDSSFPDTTETQTQTVSGGTTRSTDITGLETEYRYYIRVMAIGSVEYSDSNYSSSTMGIPRDIFTVASSVPNSLTISWTVTPAAGSVFQYRQGGDWTTWKGQSTGNSLTLSGLKAGTYEVRMVSKQGVPTDSKTETVTSSGNIVSVPLKHKASVDKKVSKPTISSVTLQITPAAKATSESNVRYVIDIVKTGKMTGRPAGFTPFTITAASLAQTSNKVLVDGLNPNTSYKFTVTAVNANGDSVDGKGKSVLVNVTAKTATYTAVQKLGLNKNVLTKGVSTTMACLTWTASKAPLPGGSTTRYEVLWYEGNSKAPTKLPTTITASVSSTGAVIMGLSPNKTYKFAVRVITTVDGLEIESAVAKVSIKTLK